jgi:hypothetical protein
MRYCWNEFHFLDGEGAVRVQDEWTCAHKGLHMVSL